MFSSALYRLGRFKMLPSSGLFKDIDCPYYDNYCGRPYCHFRHRKRNTDSAEDSQDGETAANEFPTYKPTPKSQLAQVKSHIPISYVPDTVLRPERLSRVPTTYSYSEKITYKPTPLSELSKNTTINTTAELMNKELFSNIEGNNKEEGQVTMDVIKYKDDEDCDINFEELSTEFDMIDDIINECPTVVDEEVRFCCHLHVGENHWEVRFKIRNFIGFLLLLKSTGILILCRKLSACSVCEVMHTVLSKSFDTEP